MSRMIKRLFGASTVGRPSKPPGTNDGLEGRRTNANRALTFDSQVGFKNKMPWIVMSIVLAAPQSVFACAACTGRSDDTAAQGLNAAVFTLLLMLLALYGAFISCFVYLIRRAVKHPLLPPDVQGKLADAPDGVSSFAASSRAMVNRVAPILSRLNYQTILRYWKGGYENGRN